MVSAIAMDVGNIAVLLLWGTRVIPLRGVRCNLKIFSSERPAVVPSLLLGYCVYARRLRIEGHLTDDMAVRMFGAAYVPGPMCVMLIEIVSVLVRRWKTQW